MSCCFFLWLPILFIGLRISLNVSCAAHWADYIQRDVAKALHDGDVVYILVWYVIVYCDNFEQFPCVISYFDATMLV